MEKATKILVKGHFEDESVDGLGMICCVCSEFLLSLPNDELYVRLIVPRY